MPTLRPLTLPVIAALFLSDPAVAATPAPCQVLSAAAWSRVMGYTASATPGELTCTYQGPPRTGGGQFRIMATVGSKAEADAAVKRMREHQSKGHNLGLSAVDSQGSVVFSVALFQPAPTEATPAQLEKLVAAIKLQLAQ